MLIGSGEGSNTSSSIFTKSINEMIYLTKHFKGKEDTVYGLDKAVPAVDRSKPRLLIILIVMFNFSLISIVSFFFIRENYFNK